MESILGFDPKERMRRKWNGLLKTTLILLNAWPWTLARLRQSTDGGRCQPVMSLWEPGGPSTRMLSTCLVVTMAAPCWMTCSAPCQVWCEWEVVGSVPPPAATSPSRWPGTACSCSQANCQLRGTSSSSLATIMMWSLVSVSTNPWSPWCERCERCGLGWNGDPIAEDGQCLPCACNQ